MSEPLIVHVKTDNPPPKTAFDKAVGLATSIGVVVALVVASLGLVFSLWPGLKPLGPPVKIGGVVAKVAVASNVTYGQYLKDVRLGRPAASPTSESAEPSASQVGYEISVRVDLAGDETHVYAVIPTVYEAKTLKLVPPSTTGVRMLALTPRIRDLSTGFLVWVSGPLPAGDYLFRAALYDGGPAKEAIGGSDSGARGTGPGELVDFAFSAPYTVP